MTNSSPAPSSPSYGTPQNTSGKGKSIASLILGIVSIVTSLLWFISGPAALVGIILGILGRKSEPSARGLALWGIITSVLGLVLTVVWLIAAVAFTTALQNGDITVPVPS